MVEPCCSHFCHDPMAVRLMSAFGFGSASTGSIPNVRILLHGYSGSLAYTLYNHFLVTQKRKRIPFAYFCIDSATFLSLRLCCSWLFPGHHRHTHRLSTPPNLMRLFGQQNHLEIHPLLFLLCYWRIVVLPEASGSWRFVQPGSLEGVLHRYDRYSGTNIAWRPYSLYR